MGLVFTRISSTCVGDRRVTRGTLAFDSSYPTGGEAYTYGLFGFQSKPDMIRVSSNSGFVFDVDEANKKIIARGISGAGGAAAASTDALSVKSGVLNTEDAVAFSIGLTQVQNTASLAALTAVPVEVTGVA